MILVTGTCFYISMNMFLANGRPLQHKRGLVAKSHFESWPQRILSGGHSDSECEARWGKRVYMERKWNERILYKKIYINKIKSLSSAAVFGLSGCTCCRRSFGQSFPSRRGQESRLTDVQDLYRRKRWNKVIKALRRNTCCTHKFLQPNKALA